MSDAENALTALLELMGRLRDPERGCPWDLRQTFATIAPYTIEEAYEVADAIERGDPAQIRDELGDLLFQVVFHARMAEERGWFDFAAVAGGIHDKLVRRHPHVFAGKSAASEAELSRNWEEQKARERAQGASTGGPGAAVSALADVPRALPALVRAAKLGRRAGRVGFDWPNAQQVRDKVLEELREVDAALATAGAPNAPEVVEEMGDLLFALANWSRHLQFDAEEALRGANSKFERRFRDMESLALARGLALSTLNAAEWDGLWLEAKVRESPARAGLEGSP
ncbi:MAG: Nucleoside triphosphate pyrophosphohydrolase [Gammaproteobacteria bacterium]|nr:Nucleoside triphosphate pyrophosphohydrolase [Gammaproteobacteria bacterium]